MRTNKEGGGVEPQARVTRSIGLASRPGSTARSPSRKLGCPQWDSNPQQTGPEPAASTNCATRAYADERIRTSNNWSLKPARLPIAPRPRKTMGEEGIEPPSKPFGCLIYSQVWPTNSTPLPRDGNVNDFKDPKRLSPPGRRARGAQRGESTDSVPTQAPQHPGESSKAQTKANRSWTRS